MKVLNSVEHIIQIECHNEAEKNVYHHIPKIVTKRYGFLYLRKEFVHEKEYWNHNGDKFYSLESCVARIHGYSNIEHIIKNNRIYSKPFTKVISIGGKYPVVTYYFFDNDDEMNKWVLDIEKRYPNKFLITNEKKIDRN